MTKYFIFCATILASVFALANVESFLCEKHTLLLDKRTLSVDGVGPYKMIPYGQEPIDIYTGFEHFDLVSNPSRQVMLYRIGDKGPGSPMMFIIVENGQETSVSCLNNDPVAN